MATRKIKLIKFSFIFLIVLGIFSFWIAGNFKVSFICDFDFEPVTEVEIPDYQRIELDNGMVLYLMEDDRFPVVNFYAKLRVGTVQDPEDKLGLAEITVDLLRNGGTKRLTGDEIDEKLDSVGAVISTNVSRDAGRVSGYSLKSDFPDVFRIFGEILREPVFSQDELDLIQIRKTAEIARRDDRAQNVARREFRRLVYGQDHPYARIIEIETIGSINRDDVVDFHLTHFGPDGMVLAVWGDFEWQKMFTKIKTVFADWPEKNLPDNFSFKIKENREKRLDFFPRQDLNQSQVVMGHLGMRRDDPDYFTCIVLSQLLGQGWNSRFMRHLRQEEALAYSVFAAHAANFGYPGMFIAQAQTRLERTQEAVDLMMREIKRIRKEKVALDELEAVKEGVINSSLFLFDTPDKIIRRLARYEYYGYPKNYIEKMLEGIKAVTPESLQQAAAKHLRPDELSIFIVSRREKIDQLKKDLEK